jgi:hypothetical protein
MLHLAADHGHINEPERALILARSIEPGISSHRWYVTTSVREHGDFLFTLLTWRYCSTLLF